MYVDLTSEQQAFVETVKDFAAKEIAPGATERDRAGEWYAEGWRKMGQLGLLGLQFPEAFGGSGADVVTTAAAFQAFTAGGADAGIALSWVAHSVLAGTPLWKFGTQDQQHRYLSKIATGEWSAGYGLTEPEAGSDAAALQTTAVRKGDRWILNGSKMFITNAPVGDVFVVFASEDRSLGSRGITAFIVESAFPGFGRGKVLDKMGNRTSPTGELILQDCEVPAENVLGEPRNGFAIAKTALEWERFLMMAHAVGTMQAVLGDCVRYAGERRQFRKPIAEQPAIQAKLADMRLNVAAGELFVRRVAWLKDQGVDTPLESSACKIFTSAALMHTTLQGVQVYGGYGYIRGYAVERNMRDAKLAEIGGGTTEIQRQVVGRSLLKVNDQHWDRAYTAEQVAARARPASEASDLIGACLALSEEAKRSVAAAVASAAHETVRWTLRLAGQETLLTSGERTTEQVREDSTVPAWAAEAIGARGPELWRASAGAAAETRGSGGRDSLATYLLRGDIAANAPRCELLLAKGALRRQPGDWSSEALAAANVVPDLALGRVSLHSQGQPADTSRLPAVARLFNAAVATGIAEAALDEALDAARQCAGEPDQLMEFKLADIRTRVDGARMLVHKAAHHLQTGQPALDACREARIFAAEAAIFCAQQALAVATGLGSPRLQELWRDCHAPASLDVPIVEDRLSLGLPFRSGVGSA